MPFRVTGISLQLLAFYKVRKERGGGHEAKANISWEKSLIFGKTRQTRIHLSLPP
jgi:hypothetical protein